MTDENGDPVRDGQTEVLHAALHGSHFRAAGATPDGFYLLSEKFLQFVDHDGRPLGPRVILDAFAPWWLSATTDEGVVVASAIGVAQEELIARLVRRDGTVEPWWPGRRTSGRRGLVALFSSATGAVVFSIDTNSRFWAAIPTMTFIRREERGSRVRPPIALARADADHREVTATAHAGGMVVAWSQQMPEIEVHVARLDSSAKHLLRPLIVPGGTPRIASNGEVALLVTHSLDGASAIRLGRDGRPLDETPVVLPKLRVRSVEWDGSAFLLWAFPALALRIDEFGRLLTPQPVPLTNAPITSPFASLAASPRGALSSTPRCAFPTTSAPLPSSRRTCRAIWSASASRR